MSRAMVGLVAYHRANAFHNFARPVARPFRRARVEHDDIGHGARFANRSLDSRGAIGHNLHRHEFAAPCLGFHFYNKGIRLDVFAPCDKCAARNLKLVARRDKRHARFRKNGHAHDVATRNASCHLGRDLLAGMGQNIARMHARPHGAGARETLRGRRINFNMLFIWRHLYVLNDNRRIKPLGHSDSRIGEIPVHTTRPSGRIGYFPVLEIVVSYRNGVERAGKGVRSVELRLDIAREHTARRIGNRNPLDVQR